MVTPCPRCGFATLTYNGNYYCRDTECGWIHTPYGMPDHDPAFEKALVEDLHDSDRSKT